MIRKIYILYLSIICVLHAHAQQTVGLFSYKTGNEDGYVLFSPISSDTTYLINKCGDKVHQWPSAHKPGLSSYLLSDGSLLKTGALRNSTFSGYGATGGEIEIIDWNGNLTWSYQISDSLQTQNHDVYPMPNGNILVVVWEKIPIDTALAAGRKPTLLGKAFWSAKIVELQPSGTNKATIVWQWRLWDHIIQDYDNTKPNYGVVANHPELLNLNFNGSSKDTSADWIHMNAITYNATLDQVMVSAHNLSEIWIIDHNTTTAQAAAHSGGKHNKGGDFLYRWGNPQAYNAGTSANQQLYQQHNPTWIPAGYKDAGDIMIFNNGVNRPGGNASSVIIIVPPADTAGNYTYPTAQAYLPNAPYWSYPSTLTTNFFSQVMGGAQRLANGNTLICEATKGNFFEIDSNKNTVWQYVNPVGATGPISQGTTSTTLGAFRCTLFQPTYTGFAGHTLTATKPIELNPITPSICDTLFASVINNIQPSAKLTLYPNLANNSITIHIDNYADEQILHIRDLSGRLLYSGKLASANTLLDITSFSSGMYVYTIYGNTTKATGKFVVQH